MAIQKIKTASQKVMRVAFVLIPRFNMMTLTTMIEVLRIANYLSAENKLYEWQYISFDGPDVTASNGLTINAKSIEEGGRAFDMVFIMGSWGCEHYESREMFAWLRWLNFNAVTLCGVELAVYILAKARLLSERLVTTHWSYMAGFTELFPGVSVNEQLYVIDKNIITCAGGTAGIDLMLFLIGIKHGDYLRAEIADQMLHYPVRQAETAQRHTHGSSAETIHPLILKVIRLIESNITEPAKVPEIARHIGLSQRQLERYFRRDLGCSLVQFSQLLRLQYARVLLISTNMSVRETSAASGFNSMSHFSFAFSKCFGKTPSQYRQAWPDSEPVPSWPGTVFSLLDMPRIKVLREGIVGRQ